MQSPCSLLPPFFHYFFFQLRQPALFTFALVDIRSTRRWYNTSTLAWNLCHRRHLDLLYLYCSLRCGKQNHYDGWGVTFCGTLKTLLLQNEAVPTFKNPDFNYSFLLVQPLTLWTITQSYFTKIQSEKKYLFYFTLVLLIVIFVL